MKSTTSQPRPWICAQIGARERYAIPRVLARRGKLERLITDYWWPPATVKPPGGAGRWHRELEGARVIDLNGRGLVHDALASFPQRRNWDRVLARNDWFQRLHLAKLQRRRRHLQALPAGVFFAYSYAARSLLGFFRELGWKILLGQIDPGPGEADLVARETAANSRWQSHWRPPPAPYWENLRAEQELADRILVNSAWSRRLVLEAGVDASKITVLPLACENQEGNVDQSPGAKQYPRRFDHNRPLRVLFLGQLSVRKGIHHLLTSVQELTGEPVEFWMVGTRDIELPAELAAHPQILWTGPVPGSQVDDYYARADVFILPTLSDGFALTQLEAQSWKLPVIASRHCAEVVRDGINGLILDPVDSAHITASLHRCLDNPGLLANLSEASRVADEFSMSALAERLEALEKD